MGRRSLLRILGLATLIGMPLIAWIISCVADLNFSLKEWFFPDNLGVQILIGLGYGVLVGFLASKISEQKFMTSVRERYEKIFSGIHITWFDVFFISICAGIGEEILFRFAAQSLIGIWLSAILFVAIHGYLNPKDWRISVYGLFMTVAAAGFGYFTVKYGLLTAIISHSVVDIYLLCQVKMDDKKPNFESVEYDQDTEH